MSLPHIHQAWLYKVEIPEYACSQPLELPGDLLRLDTTEEGAVERALAWLHGQLGR